MTVVYSARYRIDIGPHVFPTTKYALVSERIRRSYPSVAFLEPQPAAWDELALVHTQEYLNKLRTGAFDSSELAQLELPWSPEVVEGFRLMTGGTLTAAREAIEHGPMAFHIGGGFHHAFANHGEGFCLFNDVAVAIRLLQGAGTVSRAAVIDLDVHHGNGTAFIFTGDPHVFTFSMHQQHNYPMHKPRGSLDIGLADRAGDAVYLEQLEQALVKVFDSAPEIVFYLAGADPFENDVLGGLALTKAGLRERDRQVLGSCASRRIPTVVLLAGGYARHIPDTADIHYGTFVETIGALPAVGASGS
jgi:acetoin utilization deacetylase AcuC-like enzyme